MLISIIQLQQSLTVLRLPGWTSVTDAICDSLHWFGFPQRVTYKLCLVVYKYLHSLAPDHLAQYSVLLSDVAACSQLRSADNFQLLMQCKNTVKFGSRAFCSPGPASWNTLPAQLYLPSGLLPKTPGDMCFLLSWDCYYGRLCDDSHFPQSSEEHLFRRSFP